MFRACRHPRENQEADARRSSGGTQARYASQPRSEAQQSDACQRISETQWYSACQTLCETLELTRVPKIPRNTKKPERAAIQKRTMRG